MSLWYPISQHINAIFFGPLAMGNLVLLSGRKNSEAQNFDFLKKNQVYFEKKDTAFKVTQQLKEIMDWTPDAFLVRQKRMIKKIGQLYFLQSNVPEPILPASSGFQRFCPTHSVLPYNALQRIFSALSDCTRVFS